MTGVYSPAKMDEKSNTTNSRWEQAPWWAWLLIILFPVVLRPWWVAIISLAAFVLFLRLILGPFPTQNKESDPPTR